MKTAPGAIGPFRTKPIETGFRPRYDVQRLPFPTQTELFQSVAMKLPVKTLRETLTDPAPSGKTLDQGSPELCGKESQP